MSESSKNVYERMQQQLDEIFRAPEPEEMLNNGLEGKAYRKAVFSSFLKENRPTLICSAVFGVCMLHALIIFLLYCVALVKLDTAFVTGSVLYALIGTIIPLVTWVYSTKLVKFSFHNYKLGLLRFCMFTAALFVSALLLHYLGNVIIPLIVAMFKPTVSRSVSMVKAGCRGVLFLVSVIPGLLVFLNLNRLTTKNELVRMQILNFDVSLHFDFRSAEEKEFAYDLKIVRHLDNGKMHVIKMKDRFLHLLGNGSFSTGKTYSSFTPAIENDFEQRYHNLEHQKMETEKLLREGSVRIKAPMSDEAFSLDNFESLNDTAKKKLYELKYRSPLAGIIAMAPNEGFADEVFALAAAKGIRAHRLDPMLSANHQVKEGYKGLNPIYIKPGLSEVDYMIEVNQRATLTADVMQAVYDQTGQSNPYFAGLNQNVTTTVTALILLCAPYMSKFRDTGRVPTLSDVQEVLNDFSKAKEYRKVFVHYYAKPGTEITNPDCGKLQYIYDYVNNSLLSPAASQLFEQCQGLRNIVNALLGNPLIYNILCAQDTIDLDSVLANGEVVLVNYALNLGSSGIAFGLFFLLSLINAAYRRPNPESERLPVFLYIDELPRLLHPKLEDCFVLFRQYRIGTFVAIQSLSQLNKSPATAFLKPVLVGNCAHHFVFGRAGIEDMEIYQSLCGTSLQNVLTESLNETSLFADKPSVSRQHRKTLQRVNNMEGSDIRSRKFQECTVITVDNGTLIDAFAGKVFFLPRYRRIKKKRFEVAWSDYYDASPEPATKEPVDVPVKKNVISKDTYSESDQPLVNPSVPKIRFSAGANDPSAFNQSDGISAEEPADTDGVDADEGEYAQEHAHAPTPEPEPRQQLPSGAWADELIGMDDGDDADSADEAEPPVAPFTDAPSAVSAPPVAEDEELPVDQATTKKSPRKRKKLGSEGSDTAEEKMELDDISDLLPMIK